MNLTTFHRLVIFATTFFAVQSGNAQNMILNPGFEDVNISQLECSWYVFEADFVAAINYWDYPNTGSTDVFHMSLATSCFSHPFSTNPSAVGQQQPRSGDSMSAIVTYGSGGCTPYREYLQGELTQDLTVGTTYVLSIYVSLADYSNKATNNIGFKYTTQRQNIGNMCVWATTPDANYTGAPITDKLGWTQLTYTFTPTEAGLRYFSIGNFITDSGTTAIASSSGNQGTIRYFIDDVSIMPESCTATANAGADQIIACGTSSTVLNGSATGGIPPFTYSWSPATGLSDPNSATPTASPVTTTTYTLTVTDAALCTGSDSVTVTVTGAPAGPTTSVPTQTFCATDNPGLNDLQINGSNIQWYTVATGGTALNPSTFTMVSGVYYASQTISGCESVRIPVTVVITQQVAPAFNQVAAICEGAPLAPLPAFSQNGIPGTWTPALNNTATTTYLFTPAAGQCATTASMTIVVNPLETPVFEPLAPVCFGQNTTLPTMSLNGISGTWSPPFDPQQSAAYTFTPEPGSCAGSTSVQVTVTEPFDFEITAACVAGHYMLTAVPSAEGFDPATSTVAWELNGLPALTGISFNVTDHLEGTAISETLPVNVAATITTAQGCVLTKPFTIENMFCNIQQGISPNGDGANEFFDLRLLEVQKLSIYNRYGMSVYSRENYTREWTGQDDRGENLPDGTYFYHMTFKNGDEPKVGWIYVIRKN